MRFKAEKEQFALRFEEIDRFADWLDEGLSAMKARRQSRIRLRLLAEEILLRMRGRFGEDAIAFASLDKTLNRATLRIEIEGEPFNPLNETGDSLGGWNSSLVTAIDMDPKYAYTWGRNVLRFVLPVRKMNSLLTLAIAILLGALAGLLGLLLLPESARAAAESAVLTPLFDVWIRILNAMSGPVVFFMVITTVLNTKQITRQGGTRLYVIGRYILISLFCAAVAVFCGLALFLPAGASIDRGSGFAQQFTDRFLDVVPENIVAPFANSDTPQLMLIAFVLGGAVIALGSRVEPLKKLIQQLNMVGLLLTKWVSLLVPPFFGLFIALKIWTSKASEFLGVWKPLAASVALSALIMIFDVLLFSLFLRVSPRVILKKLLPDFKNSLFSGGVDDILPSAERGSAELLGVDRNYVKVCLPQGLVLYMPLSSVGILIFTAHIAVSYGVSLNAPQIMFAVLLAVLLFIATPPVPGANLLAYTVFFSWLGIPGQALIDAMFFDIVFGFFASAGNLSMLELETVIEARRFGLLQIDALRKPVKK